MDCERVAVSRRCRPPPVPKPDSAVVHDFSQASRFSAMPTRRRPPVILSAQTIRACSSTPASNPSGPAIRQSSP